MKIDDNISWSNTVGLFSFLGKEAFSCTSCVWSYSLLGGMCNSDCFVGSYKVEDVSGQEVIFVGIVSCDYHAELQLLNTTQKQNVLP